MSGYWRAEYLRLAEALERIKTEATRPGASLGRIRTAATQALIGVEPLIRTGYEDIWSPGADGKYLCPCGERIFAGTAHGCARPSVSFEDETRRRLEALEDGARIARLAQTTGHRDGTLGYQHEMKQQRRLEALEEGARIAREADSLAADYEALQERRLDRLEEHGEAVQEWIKNVGVEMTRWSESIAELLTMIVEEVGKDERDLVRLADALNQYAMREEPIVQRLIQSAEARIAPKEASRIREHWRNLRQLREDVAPVIERIDP